MDDFDDVAFAEAEEFDHDILEASEAFGSDFSDDVYEGWENGEQWDDERARLARRLPRFRPPRGSQVRPLPRIRRQTPSIQGAAVRGPGGTGQVRFSRPVATAQAVNALKADISKALATARQEINKVDQRLTKNTATLDRKINVVDGRVTRVAKDVKQTQDQGRMASLLPLLMTSQPKVETIRFSDDVQKNTDLKAEVKFQKDDNMLLPLLLLGGGLGGSGGGGDSMNIALLAIALSGRL